MPRICPSRAARALKLAVPLAILSLTAVADPATTEPRPPVESAPSAPATSAPVTSAPVTSAPGAATTDATATAEKAATEQNAPAATATGKATDADKEAMTDALTKAIESGHVDEDRIVELMAEALRGQRIEERAAGAQAGDADSSNKMSVGDINSRLAHYGEANQRKHLNAFATAFYRVLPQRNLELLKLLCAYPFHFEGRLVENEEAFEAEWTRVFANSRLGAAPMKRMQIFSAEEMVRHFGERPRKLAAWPVDENSYFSVAEFGGQVIVVLWRQRDGLFVAEAIHG